MAQIPPIDDAYINEVIKSAGPYNPALNKTQGVQLRELFKLMRDRFEQQIDEGGGGSATFSGLTDVQLTSLTSGQGIVWSGSNWVNQSFTAETLDTVTSRGATTANNISLSGQLAVTGDLRIPEVKSEDFGIASIWIGDGATAGIPGDGGSSTLGGLTDVQLGSLASGQALVWNGSKWVNQAVVTDLSNYWTKSESDTRFLSLHGNADSATVWSGNQYVGYLPITNAQYIMTFDADGLWKPGTQANISSFLGLGSGAYNDKTKLWATTHPDDFYISNSWDGTYWQLTSNHGSPVNVGHASDSTLFGGVGANLYHRYGGFGTDANTVPEHTTSFSYQINTPFTGTLVYFGANGYGTQFNTSYGGAGTGLAFRTLNSDIGVWNPWHGIYHEGNINITPVAGVPNRIVQAGADGYINNVWFNSSRGDESGPAASYLFDNGDGYMRKKSLYNASLELEQRNGHHQFWNSASGVGYNDGTLELINYTTRPVLGFHWGGVVASTITIESNGRIAIMNNPGSGYESLIAYDVYTSNSVLASGAILGSRGVFGYDSDVPGSVNASSWFRALGDTGLYFSSYAGGIYMSDSTWIRTFGSKGFYCDAEMQATTIRANNNLIIPTARPAGPVPGSLWIQ